MAWIGVDIGGANIKAADGSGFGLSRPFPMWRTPHLLERELRTILEACPRHDAVAVTMTGELADCFACRTEGVQFILDAVERAVGERCEVRVLLVDGSLVSLADSRRDPLRAAASNWIGLASFCGRFAPQGLSLLIDLGSTTCDIIPLRDGLPVPEGRDDLERLLAGELLYTGVVRSPVCGVVRRVPYRGRPCTVAQELFATTGDVYLTLGDLPEDPEGDQTADHRPSTRIAARARLGRMIGAEGDAFVEADAIAMSRAVQSRQLSMLRRAVRQVQGRLGAPVETVMVSGQGEFLIERLLAMWPDARRVSLRAQLGESASQCAPAHALAMLACEAR